MIPNPQKAANSVSIVFVFVLLIGACSTVSTEKIAHPVSTQLLSAKIDTTVDSEVAQYYIMKHLNGIRDNPKYDEIIIELERQYVDAVPTREQLQHISQLFSTDFATLFFLRQLWRDPQNRMLQKRYHQLIEGIDDKIQLTQVDFETYIILFIPGWDYQSTGHISGADLTIPIEVATQLGVPNVFIPVASTASVEDIATAVTNAVRAYSEGNRKIIVAGASSAGPAIYLSLADQLSPEELKHVVAWINLGGILNGSPIVDYYLTGLRAILAQLYIWHMGWDRNNIMSMSTGNSRVRFTRLKNKRTPGYRHILILNYLGLSLSGNLSALARENYYTLKKLGPNDGFTLLADSIAPNSNTIVAFAADHFLAEDPKIRQNTEAIIKLVLWKLKQP